MATFNTTVTFENVTTGYTETALVDFGDQVQGQFGLGYIPTGEYTATIRYEQDAGTGFFRTYVVPETFVTGDTGLSVSLDLPITPPAPATLRGVVSRADGTPAVGALVRLLRADNTVQTSVNTQNDGSYLLTVAPGNYRIAVAQDSQSAVVAVFLDEGVTSLATSPWWRRPACGRCRGRSLIR